MRKNPDKFDKMFYDYFKNDQEVPQRIHDAIYSAFDRRRHKKKIKQIILIILLLSLFFIYLN